jgi:hypothetical protein
LDYRSLYRSGRQVGHKSQYGLIRRRLGAYMTRILDPRPWQSRPLSANRAPKYGLAKFLSSKGG